MKIKYSGAQAAKYVQFSEKSFSWKFIEKPAIEKHLKPILKSDMQVLDAGCGAGRTMKLLFDLGVQEKNLIGTDISSDMLNITRKSFPNVKLIQADLPNLKLRSESLDLVVSNMTFNYLSQKDFKKTMENISRWLVRGGYLFLIAIHPLRFVTNHSEYFSNKVKIEKTPWGTEIEYHPKKISDYINTTINSGFDLMTVEEPIPMGEEAKKNLTEYKKYSSVPTRLLIKAIKK
ncbi:MAG TPA: class I SAM-dependent methyltransferase [Patescibacteria group bacterium]|nr:class I SAM-dependent methyltransferase [Patescibacteria group bacterium]